MLIKACARQVTCNPPAWGRFTRACVAGSRVTFRQMHILRRQLMRTDTVPSRCLKFKHAKRYVTYIPLCLIAHRRQRSVLLVECSTINVAISPMRGVQREKESVRLSDHVVSQLQHIRCMYRSVIAMINSQVKEDYETCAHQSSNKSAVNLYKTLYNAAPSVVSVYNVTPSLGKDDSVSDGSLNQVSRDHDCHDHEPQDRTTLFSNESPIHNSNLDEPAVSERSLGSTAAHELGSRITVATTKRVLSTAPRQCEQPQKQRQLALRQQVQNSIARNTGREALRRSKAIQSAGCPSTPNYANRFGSQPCFRRRGHV